ncbi:MAG: L-histidine N(alpha)-methyltransferase [Dermatophilaceae bacterium]
MPVAEALVYLGPDDLTTQIAVDVRVGLTATPKRLPPKYFYDARGSGLFEEITRLPEYYLTRAEHAILRERVGVIAALTGSETLIELGSGTSEKTRLLLHALAEGGTLRRFVPLDVDASVHEQAEALSADFPDLTVEPVVGDFERHLAGLPKHQRQLLVLFGSTIGNLEPLQRRHLFEDIRRSLGDDGFFLLGVDLVKDEGRLVAAYDDAAQVTAAFNKNMLAVLNRELGADFRLEAFDHRALWSAEHEWMEMHLVSRRDQEVEIPALGLKVPFGAGEPLRTEISAKFRRYGIEAELAAAGLRPMAWWTDPRGDFALSLSGPGPR